MFEQLVEEYVMLSDTELDDLVAEVELTKRAADARLTAAVAVIDARGSFRNDGHRSLRSYLKTTLNCSGSSANRVRRRTQLMNQHPTVGNALLAGHIGVDQADRLASARAHPRAGDRFAEFEPVLLDHAEQRTYRDFDTIVDHFIDRADPDGAFDDQLFHQDQRNASVRDDNGAVSVHASGGTTQASAEMAAVFQAAVQVEVERDFEARRLEHGDTALEHPMPRSHEQRCFDALHQIFLAWATVPANGKQPEPLVNLVVDHVTFGKALAAHGLTDTADLFNMGPAAFAAAEHDLTNHRCGTSTGTSVHPDVMLHAALAGRVRRVVIDADGVVVDMGRTRRLFTGKARQAAQLLAATCTHRGCDIPATLCDVDHRIPWANGGGRTDQSNAMPLCGPHDRWKHTHKIRTRRATNGQTYLIKPDGTAVLPVGAREPDWAEPLSGLPPGAA